VALAFTINTSATAIGRELFWLEGRLSLADAIVSRNWAEVAYQVSEGRDPNGTSVLDAASPIGRSVTVTPLEAAVITGDTEMMQLLIDSGAVLSERNLPRLRCFARRLREGRIEDFLIVRAQTPVSCERVPTPW
jgi:hypothetical protein